MFQEKEEHGSRNGDTQLKSLVVDIIMSYEPLLTSLLNTSGRQLYVYCYFTSLPFFFVSLFILVAFFSCTQEKVPVPNTHQNFQPWWKKRLSALFSSQMTVNHRALSPSHLHKLIMQYMSH